MDILFDTCDFCCLEILLKGHNIFAIGRVKTFEYKDTSEIILPLSFNKVGGKGMSLALFL